MQKLEITLTRAHKIAERLKLHANELLQSGGGGYVESFQSPPTETQMARLAERRDSSLNSLAKAEAVLHAVARVRTVIAEENQKRGINEMLAELDAVTRLSGHLKTVVNAIPSNLLLVEEIAAPSFVWPKSEYHSNVTAGLLTSQDKTELQERLRRLQAQAFKLTDRIAEANARRFTLDLEPEFCVLVGAD